MMPKRIRLYKWNVYWFVRNDFAATTTYCASHEDAVEEMEIQLLERLWQVSMKAEVEGA
jgi:hypothetical protein